MEKKKHSRLNKRFLKPFVKWAGGKNALVHTFNEQLPFDFHEQQSITYIEPFVGGGAMLLFMLSHHDNIKKVVINDANEILIHCYQLIKHTPNTLVQLLKKIEDEFYSFDNHESKKTYYLKIRKDFNEGNLSEDQRAAYFIFMNHTCFNGLYRENYDGHFNVPFGKYKRPTICNEKVILEVHKILKNVEIYCGDYSYIINHIGDDYNFVYLDPPYRPLSGKSSFNEYTKNNFGDEEQRELKSFCDKLSALNCKIMLSNSFSLEPDNSSFFHNLYKDYEIEKILAHRFINAHAEKRKKEIELLIKNYKNPNTVLPHFECNEEGTTSSK